MSETISCKCYIITQYNYCPDEPCARVDMAAWPAAVAASLERFLSASTVDIAMSRDSEHMMSIWTYPRLSLVQSPVRWLLFAQGPDSEAKCKAGYGRGCTACTHCHLPILFHYADLNVLGAGLHDLQKTLYRKFDTLVACHVIFVVLF